MSYYFGTVPINIALMLRDKYNYEVFVETGTHIGNTAEWASTHFVDVYTIEIFSETYVAATNRLLLNLNVHTHLGDSRYVLPKILHEVGKKKTLFYLDAHWSEGAHYGRPLIESAALDEVLLINRWNNSNHSIIVDDAHRFGTERWPTLEDIVNALENGGRRKVEERLDVLIATPVPILKKVSLHEYIDSYVEI